MTQRLNYFETSAELTKKYLEFSTAVKKTAMAREFGHLVDIRASQINGCAFCVDMHTRELLSRGEDLQRINSIVTWPEVDFYDGRERAALNWAERCTRLSQAHPEQQDFEALRPHFSEREMVELTYAIGSINVWNRLCAGFAAPVARKPIKL